MFAIIENGGKQYRVKPHDLIDVERLDAEVGAKINLQQVLCIMDGKGELTFGKPLVAGASVAAEVVKQFRADKVLIFKKRRRKNSRRLQGHRQNLTRLRIAGFKIGASN